MSHKNFFRCLLALASCLSACLSRAQSVPQYWAANAPTGPNFFDRAHSVMDAAGNVYVAVATQNGSTYPDVVKFSPAGEVLWTGYGAAEPTGRCLGLELTPDGGVIAGFEHGIDPDRGRYHYTVQKFSSSGALSWFKTTVDELIDVKVDKAGNVFLAYANRNPAPGEPLRYVLKRGPGGAQLWQAWPVDPPEYGGAVFYSLLPDNTGGCYASGWTLYHPTGDDYHYQSILAHLTGPGGIDPKFVEASGALLRADGGFYGWSGAGVTRFDSNLNPLWHQPYPTSIGKQFRDGVVDKDGNVIITGTEGKDVLTVKFGSNGGVLWERQWDGPDHSYDEGYSITTDGSGNVFVLSLLENARFSGNTILWALGLLKYSPSGDMPWLSDTGATNGVIVYNGGGQDMPADVHTDRTGHVVIGGRQSFVADPNYSQSIAVKYGPPVSADFVSQSVPTTMVAGQTYWVSLQFRNVGLSTWTQADGYWLQSRSPTGNTLWGRSRVDLAPGDSIGPNQGKTFGFYAVAPSTAGTYPFQWKVVKDGIGGIGIPSPLTNVSVVVKQHAARYLVQGVPTSVTAGSTFQVYVRMRNVGTNTWTAAGGYQLMPVPGYPSWGVTAVSLAGGDSVAQGQDKVFTFTCKAPSTAGNYTMRWQMHRSASAFTGFFGDQTTVKGITVTP